MARGDPGNAAKGVHAALTPSLPLCVGGSPGLGSMSTALLIFKLRLHSLSSGCLGFFAQRGRMRGKLVLTSNAALSSRVSLQLLAPSLFVLPRPHLWSLDPGVPV